MKAINRGKGSSTNQLVTSIRCLVVAVLLLCGGGALAQIGPPGGGYSSPTNVPVLTTRS